jgi:hypothetical protein
MRTQYPLSNTLCVCAFKNTIHFLVLKRAKTDNAQSNANTGAFENLDKLVGIALYGDDSEVYHEIDKELIIAFVDGKKGYSQFPEMKNTPLRVIGEDETVYKGGADETAPVVREVTPFKLPPGCVVVRNKCGRSREKEKAAAAAEVDGDE